MTAVLERIRPASREPRPPRTRAELLTLVAVPFFASLLVTQHELVGHPLEIFVGAVAGAFVVWGVMRRPTIAGPILFVLLPVQTVVFAWIYAQGFDAGSFRPLAALKELALLGLLLRAERDRRAVERPLDALDKAAVGFLLLAVFYLVAGRYFAEGPGFAASGRLAGFREDALFVVALYAGRNITWTAREVRGLLRWLGAGIAVAGAFALWHQVRDSGFTTWLVDDAQIVPYLRDVLLLDDPAIVRTLHHFVEEDVRLMGSFLSPIQLADYLLIPAGILLVAAIRSRGGVLPLVLLALNAWLLVETSTRIALVALCAMVAVLLLVQRAASTDRRVTAAVVVAAVALVAVPVVVAPMVINKDSAAESNQGHIDEWTYAFSELVARPQGSGLGSNNSASVRFSNVDRSNGSAYLLVGNELGVAGLALFLAIIGLTARGLARRLRDGPQVPVFVLGAGLGAVGIAVTGLTHHSLSAFPVAWTLWLLLGMGCAHVAVESPPSYDEQRRVRSGSEL